MLESATFLYNPAIDHGAPTHWGVIAGNFHETSDYEVHRPQGTRDWLLTLTLGGRGGFSTDEKTTTVERFDVTLVAPGCPHHYGTIGETWRFFWVHFYPQPHWRDWLHVIHRDQPLSHWPLENAGSIRRIIRSFKRLVSDSVGLGIHERALAANAVEEILIVLAAEVERDRQSMDSRVQETVETLTQQYASNLTIEGLAKGVGLSPSRLSHLFKAETGTSLVAALQQIRLQHAARYLARTTLSVSEIAERVGFNSPYYFSKQFRQYFGTSPTDYRRKATDLL